MQRRSRGCINFPLTLTVLLVLSPVSEIAGAAPPVEEDRGRDLQVISRRADLALGLIRSVGFHLSAPDQAAAPREVKIPLNGRTHTLELSPHSVRSPNFRVQAQGADGSYIDVQPGPARTFRGTVRGISDSAVAASWSDDGLRARIIFPDDTQHWVEPVPAQVAGALPGDHVIYREGDALAPGGVCLSVPVPVDEVAVDESTAGATAGSSVAITELGIDADFEFFQRYGTVDATLSQIESVINSMNIQYERDVLVRHDISHVIIRTAEPDPYSSTNPNTLLTQFRDHWRNFQSGVQRDVAQLFTGKNIDGNVIGIAFLSTICSSVWGYGVVQSDFTTNFACKTDLSAHELGHNWSAQHCTCSGWTMNPSITCANRFHPDFSVPGIMNFRATRSCLDFDGSSSCVVVDPPGEPVDEAAKNRYLAIDGVPGVSSAAVRVIFDDLPPPYSSWNGVAMWVGNPREVSLDPGANDDTPPTFLAARLQCDPFYADWEQFGPVFIYHEGVIPGGRYRIHAIDGRCSIFNSENFSEPVVQLNGLWGDVSGPWNEDAGKWDEPDGIVTVSTDLVASIDSFLGIPAAPSKTSMDLAPATPDQRVTIGDILAIVDAVLGKPYPYAPGATLPCN